MKKTILLGMILGACLARAQEEEEDAGMLWGWNVSAGGNIGFGLKTNLKILPGNALRAMPSYRPNLPSKAAAVAAKTPVAGGSRVTYTAANGETGYVDPESSWGALPGQENETWNWKLPDSAIPEGLSGAARKFVFQNDNAWADVVSESITQQRVRDEDRDAAFGASVELTHALWMSEDATWGVDVAFGLTWMRANDCFGASGVGASREATIERGNGTITEIEGEFFGLGYAEAESDGTWGNAGGASASDPSRNQFIIDMEKGIHTYPGSSTYESYADEMRVSAWGDYEEWEISALLRPWYEINDWMCLHAALGLGVTRSSFEYTMSASSGGASIYHSTQQFDEWRCYGLAGLGVLFRFWDFDISCDALFRWCQQDMEIHGRDVSGSIEKPWFVLRLGMSYAF